MALANLTHILIADLLLGESVADIRLPVFGGSVQFSPDGRVLALLNNHDLWFWTHTSGLTRVEGAITTRSRIATEKAFAFHPTAPLFVALNPDGLPTLFNRDTHQPIRAFDFAVGKRVKCATFSPDGLTCAVGGSNKRFAVFDVDV